MRNLKCLVLSGLAATFVLGVGSTQAKEWEQSFTVDLSRHEVGDPVWGYSRWGFSKDSLVEGYSDKYSTWEVYESCVCGFFMFGSCGYDLISYNFFDYDQHFWKVVESEKLNAGKALDLTDSSVFENANHQNGSSLHDSYEFSMKKGLDPDTNYFVFKKDSSYYALCQYITVYDTVHNYNDDHADEGFPMYFVHQCIYQDDGTPTFSKIPSYSGKLPVVKTVIPPTPIVKTVRNRNKVKPVAKPYLVNGRSANGNSANGVRVEKECVYRSSARIR